MGSMGRNVLIECSKIGFRCGRDLCRGSGWEIDVRN